MDVQLTLVRGEDDEWVLILPIPREPVPLGQLPHLLEAALLEGHVADGEDPLLAPLLEELGYTFERAKTNMGLGRVTNVQKAEGIGDQHLASVR